MMNTLPMQGSFLVQMWLRHSLSWMQPQMVYFVVQMRHIGSYSDGDVFGMGFGGNGLPLNIWVLLVIYFWF